MKKPQSHKDVEFDHKEYRQGPDFIIKLPVWLSFLGWGCFLVGLGLIDRARPERDTFIPKLAQDTYDYGLRSTWDEEILRMVLYFFVAGLFTGIIALAINGMRQKRYTDRLRYQLMVLIGLSLTGIVGYFL